jgi:hypothetical protein
MIDERRFYEAAATGLRRSAPAALRNREPITEVLAEWLPERGLVLEIASGTGEHAAHFAERFPQLEWQPSDIHADALVSIAAWVEEARLQNLHFPVAIDALARDWPVDRADAVLSINMVHISPWSAAIGLLNGAARILTGGPLILYGPWLKDDMETAPSNREFDASLKSRDPEWGLRRVEDFAEAAEARGLALTETRAMPANNLMLLFRPQRINR